MGTYLERDADKLIPLVSADGGATWYPRGGDPSQARPADNAKVIRLTSVDAGVTWTPV